MAVEKQPWIDVQALMPRVSIQQIAAYYRFALSESFGTTGEQRMQCPVASCDGRNDPRSVAINVSNPKGLWKCHRNSYGCGAGGDKLTLMYCMKHGQMPAGGGQPKGKDFREVATDLQAILGGAEPQAVSVPNVVPATTSVEAEPGEVPIEDQPNEPLSKSDNETRRSLAELDKQLIVDPNDMNPAASRYIRSRPWATPELLRESRCGYMPSDANSTMRGQWVFGVFDEQGETLCWVGRNLKYEEQMAKLRPGEEEPAKYRFPSQKFFRRKFELYGQEALDRPELQESLRQNGLILVEGFWDVLRLRQLGVASVGIMSNHITDEQLARVVVLARTKSIGKVGIMFDANEKGDEGAKEALWKVAQTGLGIRLVWSQSMVNGRFRDREPELLQSEDWKELANSALMAQDG